MKSMYDEIIYLNEEDYGDNVDTLYYGNLIPSGYDVFGVLTTELLEAPFYVAVFSN